MNKEKLLESLSVTLDYINSTAKTASEQAPLVIHEYLQWYFWKDIASLSLLFLLLIFTFFWHRHFMKKSINKFYKSKYDEYDYIPLLFTVPASLFGIAGILVVTMDLIKLQCAPRIYILESLKGLLS